jgi:hypothetical protein
VGARSLFHITIGKSLEKRYQIILLLVGEAEIAAGRIKVLVSLGRRPPILMRETSPNIPSGASDFASKVRM